VRELREHLALAAEARQDLGAREARAYDLDRRALGETAVDPFGGPDLAHAAAAELLADLPGAEAFGYRQPALRRELVGKQLAPGCRRHFAAQLLDRPAVRGVERKELLDLGGERRVGSGERRQAGGAPGGVEVAERREVARLQLCRRLAFSHRSAAPPRRARRPSPPASSAGERRGAQGGPG
jgi:hypothetical protein